LVTDSTPSPVAAGGGAFIAHVVVQIQCSLYQVLVFGLSGTRIAVGSLVNHPKTKNPACFAGEQGSQKSVI
jgi:hypothetical protein